MTTFLEIATAALSRGFKIAPVQPAEKRGVFWGQYSNPIDNLTLAIQCSKDYPHHAVGIVSTHGVGNLCFLDIDANGVIDQIERESGHRMPDTLQVLSQPSKPWKRHFYFTQTVHCCATFTKETTGIADLTRYDANGKYQNRYDFKGVGGGGYVVAAGCVRDNGEIYTYIENPILPIPDWLVDWIRQDVYKFRSARAILSAAEKQKHAEAVRTGVIPEYQPNEIRIALYSRVQTFAHLGCRRETIERLLREQVEDFIKNGKKLAVKWKTRIHKAAYDDRLKFGRLRKEFLPKSRPLTTRKAVPVNIPKSGEVEVMVSTTMPRIIRRHEMIKEKIKELRKTMAPGDAITSAELYAHLKVSVERAGLTLDPKNNADRISVGKQMRSLSFKAKNIGGVHTWVKKQASGAGA